MSDISRRKTARVGVYGIAPGYIDTIEAAYQSYSHYNTKLTRLKEPNTFTQKLMNYIYDLDGITAGE